MGIVELLRQIPDIHFTENENMSVKTSLAVGGNARYYVCPDSAHAVIECLKVADKANVPYKIIGNGTNLLVSDSGYNGLIVCTRNLCGVLLDKGETIALCGTPLVKLVNFVSGSGRTGAEGLIGIPATVGGALTMNAGAFGYSVSDCVSEITCVSGGEIIRRKKAECGFGYRTSAFKFSGEFIVSAKFRFPKRKVIIKNDFYERRLKNQPSGKTCGSVFKNPAGDFAGRLIESAGLKNATVGGARVSEKHANFIITEDGATSRDVYDLIAEIKAIVLQKFGVRLKEEVEYLGEF
ncbi:MAG: UDP-N-acetylmuramate dehydrogenase [Clostridia bacterium]|nr:UDP-N-acetylmuramate dehydrogenase [Clostridia bacterium]